MKYFRDTDNSDTYRMTPREEAIIAWGYWHIDPRVIKQFSRSQLLIAAIGDLLNEGTPSDFLKIAMICKINSRKGKENV